MAALLALAVSVLVLAGILLAPWLIDVIAPGFDGEKREATTRLVRILFPGAGLLVFSAWCLGVLNSHRRFFLSYVAPVVWNLAIIAALVGFGGGTGQYELATIAAWGSVAGSLLQFGVQLPTVLRLLGGVRPGPLLAEPVRAVVRNFVPVFVGRGVVQISAYVDTLLASFLPTGAVAAVSYAQVLYTLPVSLFGMSVSAAELPEMSSATGTDAERAAYLRGRLESGLRQIAFFVVPSVAGFVALGDVVTGALYQSGAFTREMTLYVWAILAAASVGLLPSTLGRLYSSAFYALHDTRTPLRIAIVRVSLGIALGYALALRPARGARPRPSLGRRRNHPGIGTRRRGGVPVVAARAERPDRVRSLGLGAAGPSLGRRSGRRYRRLAGPRFTSAAPSDRRGGPDPRGLRRNVSRRRGGGSECRRPGVSCGSR